MAANTVKTRIQLKNDTENNWNKAINFIPLRGELIIYSTDETHPFSRIKVGDGSTPVVDLPFLFSQNSGGGDTNVQYNTTAYWNSLQNFIPEQGAILVYSDKSIIVKDGTTYDVPAIKIGDGTSYLIDLPFVDETMYEHINNSAIHVSPEDRDFWNNKLNCNEIIINETLQLNRR